MLMRVQCTFIVIVYFSRENRFYGIFFKSIHFFAFLLPFPLWQQYTILCTKMTKLGSCIFFIIIISNFNWKHWICLKPFSNWSSIYWIIGIILERKSTDTQFKTCRIENVWNHLIWQLCIVRISLQSIVNAKQFQSTKLRKISNSFALNNRHKWNVSAAKRKCGKNKIVLAKDAQIK